MNNEDLFNALKKILANTVDTIAYKEVRKIIAESEERMLRKISRLKERVTAKIDESKEEIMTAVADTMQHHIDNIDERLEDHEKRLHKLERKPA